MNKITSVRFLCRNQFKELDTIDIGGNKIEEVPIAFFHYLTNLCTLMIINNDI